jgi:hypothetical protein
MALYETLNSAAAGKCFLVMLGVFAEFETNLRRERQLEGIVKASTAGVYKGSAGLDRCQPSARNEGAGAWRVGDCEGTQDRQGVRLSGARSGLIHMPASHSQSA